MPFFQGFIHNGKLVCYLISGNSSNEYPICPLSLLMDFPPSRVVNDDTPSILPASASLTASSQADTLKYFHLCHDLLL